jgi:ribosomal protein L40E
MSVCGVMLDSMAETVMWRSASLAQAIGQIEAELDRAWAGVLGEFAVGAGSPDEVALGWLVVDDPAEHDWRLVDAALDRLTCTECGSALTKGPVDCRRCSYYDQVRFAAREVDRPAVPPGNEHAIRVSVAVARNRARYAARVRAGYELVLPSLVDGALPSTKQAQAARALINKLTPEECETVASFAEVEELARTR